jgi:catechol 2,3-dioxygenase-like lactoylglutathione lyase family enzyme
VLNSFKIVAFVLTTDSVRARSFYEGILGLEFVSDDQYALVLRGNGTMLRIAKVQSLAPLGSTVLGWEVSNIDQAVKGLMERGLSFEQYPWVQDATGLGIWTAPTGDKVAWFKDPEGNVLSLSQHVPQ